MSEYPQSIPLVDRYLYTRYTETDQHKKFRLRASSIRDVGGGPTLDVGDFAVRETDFAPAGTYTTIDQTILVSDRRYTVVE